MQSQSSLRRSAPILVPVFLLALCLIALGVSGWSPGSAVVSVARVEAQGASAPVAPEVSPTVPARPTTVTSDSDAVPAEHGVLYLSAYGPTPALYRVDTHTGAATYVGPSGASANAPGLAPGPDSRHLYGSRPSGLLVINRDGSGITPAPTPYPVEGLAYMGSPDRLYGVTDNSFFRLHPASGTPAEVLASPGKTMSALAEDMENNLIYGLTDDGDLMVYDLDLAVPSWVFRGQALGAGWQGGLAYDPIDHVLYANGSDGVHANLYRLNPANGIATLIGPLGTGLDGSQGGLAFVPGALAYVSMGDDNYFHYLDPDLFDLGRFPLSVVSPGGIATDGDLILVSDYNPFQIVAYDFAGVEQYRLTFSSMMDAALEIVDDTVAVAQRESDSNDISFYDLRTGAFRYSIAAPTRIREMAYDGSLLWVATADHDSPPAVGLLVGLNPATGAVTRFFAFPHVRCNSWSQSLAASPPGQLTLTCDNDYWYRVSSANGALQASGVLGLPWLMMDSVPPAYVAGTTADKRAHLLDRNLFDMGSFALERSSPIGLATDGQLIYCAQQYATTIIAYDYNGVEQYRWSSGYYPTDAIEWLPGSLALSRSLPAPETVFLVPETGQWQRTFPGVRSLTALAWDGRLLWHLGDQLYGKDPNTGTAVLTRALPITDCGGLTALTYGGPGQLIAGCGTGRWVRFRPGTADPVAYSGNGLNLFALATRRQPPWSVYLPLVVR
ncbi:MAG: NHL repeat-containing protein [Anaerolineae bacterium]